MSSARVPPTIAVVAVPGAFDHHPGSAARAVADLLLRLRGPGGSRFSSFAEHVVRIPTAPARVNPRSAPNVAPDLQGSVFAEQHPFLQTQLQYGGTAARDREEDSPDHQMMRAQLAEYRSAGEPYDTVRLEGERLGESGNGGTGEVRARLHVYELRWADLSYLRSGALRVFAELYQLFVHVAHLGRTALDHARLEHSASALWRAYGGAHTWAVRLLTVFVPAFFITMLATVAAAAVVGLAPANELLVGRLALGAWVLAAGGLVYLAFRAYARLRPGAMLAGLGVYAAAAASMALVAARSRSRDELLDGALHVFEVQAVAAAIVWDALYVLGAIAGALGLVVATRLSGAARMRAWRAVRTVTATLALSVASVVVATFVIWAAVYRVVESILPARLFVPVVPAFRHGGHDLGGFFDRVLDVSAGAGLPVLLLIMGVLAAIAIAALTPTLRKEVRPPRAGDVFDERANDGGAPPRDAPIDTDVRWAAWEHLRHEDDASQRLGERVTRSSRLLSVLLVTLYVAVFVLAPAISVAQAITDVPALERLHAFGGTISVAVAGLFLALAVGLVSLRRRLPRLALGFGPAVEMVLALDNYLRTHPRDSTPRARIAERYVSLLRYLCHWRDRTGRPYDAIVVVAQSQGAAITADLLAFVQREEDAELEPLRRPLANGVPGATGRRLFLFTMGSPHRQLYSEWFPHLFGWIRGEVGDGVSRPLPAVPREPWMLLPRLEDGHRVYAPAIPDGAAPDPYAMGITRWVNAYRSGDYVGRALWRHSVDECDWLYRAAPPDASTRFVGDVPPVTYVSEDAHRSRRELCIGAGAHTHYWDSTARAIAVELDLLLSDAAKLAVRVSKDTGAPAEGMES